MSLIKYCDFEFASEKSWAVQKWTGCKWIRMSFECEWSKPPHGARERCVTTTTQTAFGGAFAICFFVGKNNKVTASERTLTANSDVDFASTIFPTWSANTPSLVALQNKLEVVIPQQMLIIHQWPREFRSIFFSLLLRMLWKSIKLQSTNIDLARLPMKGTQNEKVSEQLSLVITTPFRFLQIWTAPISTQTKIIFHFHLENM